MNQSTRIRRQHNSNHFKTKTMAISNTTLIRLISHGLTLALLVAHTAMTVIDFFGVYQLADFLRREDGSRMDPRHMLPLEELFVAMVAFPFLIILVSFALLTRRDAARLSGTVHALYTFHQVWKKDVWDAAIHPESDFITTPFLIFIHILWTIVSLVIWRLEQPSSSVTTAVSQKAKVR
jgi:hypothetical protein